MRLQESDDMWHLCLFRWELPCLMLLNGYDNNKIKMVIIYNWFNAFTLCRTCISVVGMHEVMFVDTLSTCIILCYPQYICINLCNYVWKYFHLPGNKFNSYQNAISPSVKFALNIAFNIWFDCWSCIDFKAVKCIHSILCANEKWLWCH